MSGFEGIQTYTSCKISLRLDYNKELYFLTGTETFAKEPKFWKIIARAKVDARAVLLWKSTGFCRMSVTVSLLRLGALLRDNLQMGAFS